jgi:hypothetical protein
LNKECTHPGCLQRIPEGSDKIKCLGCGAIKVSFRWILPGTEDAVSLPHPTKVYIDEMEEDDINNHEWTS